MSDQLNTPPDETPLMLEKFSMADFDLIKSDIPEELLVKLTAEEKFLFTTVSLIKAQNRTLAQNQVRHNETLRTLIHSAVNTRDWRMVLSSKWGMITVGLSTVIMVLLTEFVKLIVSMVWKKSP